ncbi:MAG: LysR family transcriptional regulator, partial [Peristeroidobacter soli]
QEYASKMEVAPVRLGRHGIAKQIFLGARESDLDIRYLSAFIELARQPPAVTRK